MSTSEQAELIGLSVPQNDVDDHKAPSLALTDSVESEGEDKDKKRLMSTSSFKTDRSSSSPQLPAVSFRTLFKYADGTSKFYMLIGTIGACANGVGFPLFSVVFGDLMDALAANGDVGKQVGKYSLRLILLGVMAGVGSLIQVKLWHMAAQRQMKIIRSKFLQSALAQEMGWFDRESVGSITNKLVGDTELLSKGIGDKVGGLIQNTVTSVVGMALGFIYGWQLALVTLASLPALAITGSLFAQVAASMTSKSSNAYGAAGAVVEEVLGGVRTVQSFAAQDYECERYHEQLKIAEKFGVKKGQVIGALYGGVYAVMFLSYALSFWYGGKLIMDNTINPYTGNPYTGGNVMTVFFAILIGSFALGTATPFISAITTARGAAASVFSVIDRESEIRDGDHTPDLDTFSGSVAFKDVYFNYPTRSDVPVHQGLDFQIEAGQAVALVGESGCGKSTVVALLERFYDPQDGSIELGGVDIRNFKLHDLRQMISLVPQQPNLFFGTIADNIRMGVEEISDEEVIAAAKLANAHEFISKLPEGYNTPIGQSGSELLSGGQKQRVAIARAIIRKPKILLLDEATSALDNESEKLVQHALENVMSNQTTIIIAHRLSTVRNADRILVIERGVVVEDGSHDVLIQKENGAYHKLVKAQEMSAQLTEEEDLKEDVPQNPSKKPSTKQDETIVVPAIIEQEPEMSLSFSVRKSVKEIQDLVTETELVASSIAQGDEEEEKTEADDESAKKPNVKKIFKLSKPEWPILFMACIGASVNGIVFPSFAIVVSKMINIFYLKDHAAMSNQIRKYAFMFIGLAVLEIAANYFSRFFFSIVGEKLTTRLRLMTLRSLLNQEIAFFDDTNNSVGALTAKLSNDAAQIRGLTVDWSNQFVQGLTTVAVGVSLSFYFDWRVTLFLFAFAPLIFLAGAGQMAFMQGGEDKTDADSSRVISEAFGAIRTVRSFNMEESTLDNYGVQLDKFAKIEARNGFVFGFFFGLSQFILFATFGAALWFSGYLIDQGKSTFSNSFQAFYVMTFTFMSMGEMNQLSPDIQKAKTAAMSIFALIERKSAIDPSSEDGELVQLEKSSIKFSKVDFSYPGRREVQILQGFSIDFAPGKVVALVGPSGSGKSTIISLIERFYDVDAGSVFIGDHDLRNVKLQELRKQMAIVSQDPVLFDMSIRDNINYGVRDSSKEMDKAILEAAKKANILDLIEDLPEGLDTFVGRRGSKLSGGQRQRVAIARAVLKDPKLLLLDEATSALDNESEKIIQESLSRLMEGRTTLMIAHRLSTVRNADEIVVMSEGKVVERGTHAELMAMEGLYSTLVRAGDAH
eukprot:TRINITY_DN1588_c0_g1_i1.p1 TRINITY_DN1588_c0_g1~~TRINITY_DN1588_c0_g1_i1.p1  ORF type:complete len:1318 (-),score=422.18 TRINITY_DN1588_c0_g1_i1:240-4193(-)